MALDMDLLGGKPTFNRTIHKIHYEEEDFFIDYLNIFLYNMVVFIP